MAHREITYRDFLQVEKEMTGYDRCRQTLIEAIDIVCEEDKTFPKNEFIGALAECLYENGIIRESNLMELCVLDSKVIAKFGRNYRMVDLLHGVAAFYMIREVIPRTNVELRNNVVSLSRFGS